MTKEEARKMLEDSMNDRIKRSLTFCKEPFITLPITDEVYNTISTNVNGVLKIESFSFKGLIKIAYDL